MPADLRLSDPHVVGIPSGIGPIADNMTCSAANREIKMWLLK